LVNSEHKSDAVCSKLLTIKMIWRIQLKEGRAHCIGRIQRLEIALPKMV